MAANYDRFQSAKTNVLAVALSKPAVAAVFLRHNPLPFPLVCDPERAAYQAFGLGRTSWMGFLRPSVLWGYLSMIVRGGKVRKPHQDEDVLQLGGDFVLDRSGTVVFEYRSRTATDRPTMAALLAAVAKTGYR